MLTVGVILIDFLVVAGAGIFTAFWLGMRGRVPDQEPLPTRTFLHYLGDASGLTGDQKRSKDSESTGADAALRDDV